MNSDSNAVRRVRHPMRWVLAALLACVALVQAPATRADENWARNDYEFATRTLDDFYERYRNDLVDPIARGIRDKRPAGPARQATKEAAALTSAPVAAPVVPAKLAAHYPPERRTRAEQYFKQLLAGYAQLEDKLGLPRNDLPGALTSFLAGSYMAYTDVPFPDEHYKPLLEQMRGILTSDPGFAKVSKAGKQEVFEQFAILGMMMATTQLALQKQPDARQRANLREAAKGYLEQLLRTDADRVRIDAQGLTIQPPVR